jgi:hypothetical protein
VTVSAAAAVDTARPAARARRAKVFKRDSPDYCFCQQQSKSQSISVTG